MPRQLTPLPTLIASVLCALGLSACAATPPTSPSGMAPFSTDGCSLFPDRALIGNADWRACCVAHDHAYWRGGTVEARLKADQTLKACVIEKTGNAALAELMYLGVRSGGGPYYYTRYRWAYGWPYGRGYAPLTRDEEALADSLEREPASPTPARDDK